MADIFYADETVVTLGDRFSTDFRYLREAITSSTVTYMIAGPTYVVGTNVIRNKIGTWNLTNFAGAGTPSQTATNVAL